MARKKSTRPPMSAEEKAATAALTTAQQVGLEAQQVRAATQSRGAYKGRTLRAGGSELQRYNLGRFTSDPFPRIGTTTGGGGNPGPAPSAPRTPRPTRPKARTQRSTNRGHGTTSPIGRAATKTSNVKRQQAATGKAHAAQDAARRAAEEEAKRIAAAKRASARRKGEENKRSTGNVVGRS